MRAMKLKEERPHLQLKGVLILGTWTNRRQRQDVDYLMTE